MTRFAISLVSGASSVGFFFSPSPGARLSMAESLSTSSSHADASAHGHADPGAYSHSDAGASNRHPPRPPRRRNPPPCRLPRLRLRPWNRRKAPPLGLIALIGAVAVSAGAQRVREQARFDATRGQLVPACLAIAHPASFIAGGQ